MLRESGRKMIVSFPLKLKTKKNEHKFAPNTLQKQRPVKPGIILAAEGHGNCRKLQSHQAAQPGCLEIELYQPHTCICSSLERRYVSVEYQCFWLLFFCLFLFYLSPNLNPRGAELWYFSFWLPSRHCQKLGRRGPLPHQLPGLPEDIGQLCLTSVTVVSQAPGGKGLEACGPSLQEVPRGS